MRYVSIDANTPDQELFTNATFLIGKDEQRSLHLDAATIAGDPKQPNEDAFAVTLSDGKLFAGVFDGVNIFKPIRGLGSQSAARFASHFLRDNFFQAVSTDTPQNVILELNQRLLQTTLLLDGATLTDTTTFPGATATVIKIDADTSTLSFAHIADSFGIAYYKDNRSELFTADRTKIIDYKTYELIAQIARERGIPPCEARTDERVQEALLSSRKKNNNKPDASGIGLINGDPNVSQYIQTGELPLEGITAILVGSDGLVPPGWTLDTAKERRKLLNELEDGGFEKLFKTKKATEDGDPDWKHIRYKHSDDATGILLTFK